MYPYHLFGYKIIVVSVHLPWRQHLLFCGISPCYVGGASPLDVSRAYLSLKLLKNQSLFFHHPGRVCIKVSRKLTKGHFRRMTIYTSSHGEKIGLEEARHRNQARARLALTVATAHELSSQLAIHSHAFARLTSAKKFHICSTPISREFNNYFPCCSPRAILFYYVAETPRARSPFSHWVSTAIRAEECRGAVAWC